MVDDMGNKSFDRILGRVHRPDDLIHQTRQVGCQVENLVEMLRDFPGILDIRLRQLAKLEEIEIRGERDKLEAERSELEKVLGSRARLLTLVKKELQEIAKKYGDERMSRMASDIVEAAAYTEEDLAHLEASLSRAEVASAPDAAKALIGSKLDAGSLEKLAAACAAACRPIDDKRGTIEFRTKVAGVLARRAAEIAYKRAGGK